MTEYLLIYLLQILPVIKELLSMFATMACIFWLVCLYINISLKYEAFYFNSEAEEAVLRFLGTLAKPSLIAFLISLILSISLPNRETLLLATGIHYGKKVVASEKVGKVNKIVDLKLDEVIKGIEGK